MQEPSQRQVDDRGISALEMRLGALRGTVRRLLAVRAAALIYTVSCTARRRSTN